MDLVKDTDGDSVVDGLAGRHGGRHNYLHLVKDTDWGHRGCWTRWEAGKMA